MIEALGVPPERVHTVYYGADPERFRPPTPAERAEARAMLGWAESDDRPAVAFVGALGDAPQGVRHPLRGLATARRRPGLGRPPRSSSGPGRRSRPGGRGPTRRAWASRSGSSASATTSPGVLAACDLLVSPTRYEAYGLNVQEALCCGLPAIVSAGGGRGRALPRVAPRAAPARPGRRGRPGRPARRLAGRPRPRPARPSPASGDELRGRRGTVAPPRSSPWPGARLWAGGGAPGRVGRPRFRACEDAGPPSR